MMEWISVSERLPKSYQSVLVWVGWFEIAFYSKDTGAWYYSNGDEENEIIMFPPYYWAEIEPPKDMT